MSIAPPIRCSAIALLLAISLAPFAATTAGAGETGPVEFAEPRQDKALVYFIRASRFTGSARTMWIYADQVFLGVLDNGTYGYAYVEPGKHLFWTNFTKATRELEVVPGETYYLGFWMDVGVLGEARGKALIEEVGERVTPDESEAQKAEKLLRRKYDKAIFGEASKSKTPVAEVVAPPPPENTEGLLKVPVYTMVPLEILETVTSEFSPAGTAVMFRVAEDAAVNGQVFVRRGTIVRGVVRESEQAGAFGKAGVLEVAVPSLAADDGTTVPLIAQLAGAGKGREDVMVTFQLGVLPGLAVRGREAFYLAGDRFKAWTRGEVWVKPGSPAPVIAGEDAAPAAGVAEAAPEPPGVGAAVVSVTAQVAKAIRFVPRKGYKPDDVRLLLQAAAQPVEVWIERIGTTILPSPVRASAIARQGDGWACTFDGWDVVRFVKAGAGESAAPLVVRGRLGDGRAFSGEATASLEIEME